MTGLRHLSKLTVFFTFLLIFAGGMVTSTGSGLSVPDWPNTYGYFMFSFPLSQWVGGIFYEHSHRLIASFVGFLTVILTIWIWKIEKREWLKKVSLFSLFAVICQGVLGGLTVLFLLPTPVSMMHAVFAQTFLCLMIAISYFLSKEWGSEIIPLKTKKNVTLFWWVLLTFFAIYIQLILGAWMRHTGSGFAIMDFPLSDGHIIPRFNDDMLASINSRRFYLGLEPVIMSQVVIHFIHRLGALLVSVCMIGLGIQIIHYYKNHRKLFFPTMFLLVLLVGQITLAAFVIWTGKAPIVTSLHVWMGALMLGISLFLMLRCYRFLDLPSISEIFKRKSIPISSQKI